MNVLNRVNIYYAYLCVILVGIVDFYTGQEVSFSLFYLLPVSLYAVSENASKRKSLYLSGFAAILWEIAEIFSGHIYSHHLILQWNVFVRLSIFLAISYFIIHVSHQHQVLSEQNEKLKELNDQKGELLGMAAHDLRSPIANIQMFSKLMLDEEAQLGLKERIEFLKHIHDSSKFMLKLLNNLLDVSKIEAGKLVIEKINGDYIELVEEVARMSRFLAGKKDIEVNLNFGKNIPQFAFDRGKLDEVITNLVENAIKFSYPETTITISVEYEKGFVTTKVTDQGQGIPEEELARIFRPFYRGSVKSTAGERSTGLGLAIVKKIVECHDGVISVSSAVGKGTEFSFRIPVIDR